MKNKTLLTSTLVLGIISLIGCIIFAILMTVTDSETFTTIFYIFLLGTLLFGTATISGIISYKMYLNKRNQK